MRSSESRYGSLESRRFLRLLPSPHKPTLHQLSTERCLPANVVFLSFGRGEEATTFTSCVHTTLHTPYASD